MSEPSEQQSLCELCGEPMPSGEEMFKFHGYSGNCPKPPLDKTTEQLPDSYVIAIYEGQPPLRIGGTFVVTEIEHSDNRKMLARIHVYAPNPDPVAEGLDGGVRRRALIKTLTDERKTLIYWLLRCYQSGHREGWEDGPSVKQTMDNLLDVLANRGYDPNEDEAAKELLKQEPRF